MSLDKAIAYGKERRKPYRGSKAIDRTCRNHGGCPWCEENRQHKFRDKHPPCREDEDENGGVRIYEIDKNGYVTAVDMSIELPGFKPCHPQIPTGTEYIKRSVGKPAHIM